MSMKSLRKSIITISEKCSSYDVLKIFIYQFSGPSSLVCNLEASRSKRIANLPFIETEEYLVSEEVGEEWDKGLPPALFELDNSYSPVE